MLIMIRPDLDVGTRVTRSFWLGFAAAMFMMALIQDWFGQQGWIELLENHWTHMHWAWWILPIVLVVVTHLFNKVAAELQDKDNAG